MNKASRTYETLVKPIETEENYPIPNKAGKRPQQHTLVKLMSEKGLNQAGLKALLIQAANRKHNNLSIPPDLANTLFHGKPILWQYAEVVCSAFDIVNPEEIFRAVTQADLEKEAIKKDPVLAKKRKNNFRRRQAIQKVSS